MGKLIDGAWTTDDRPSTDDAGRWQRTASRFRDWVDAEQVAPGRYRLIVAMSCPWAHRTMIVRKLKRLENIVPLAYVLPKRTDQGWVFDGGQPLHELYTRSDPKCTARATVPVLFDDERGAIVNNESSEIIRMFDDAFATVAPPTPDLYPEPLRAEIDAINERVYATVNNGVYRAGFARTQRAYDEAFDALFDTLAWLDERLADRPFLVADTPLEPDWRLFPTLIRFDVAYYGAFKCNLRRIQDYPNLGPYLRRLYDVPGIADTVDFDIYRRGYYSKSERRNPHGIIPTRPQVWGQAPGS